MKSELAVAKARDGQALSCLLDGSRRNPLRRPNPLKPVVVNSWTANRSETPSAR